MAEWLRAIFVSTAESGTAESSFEDIPILEDMTAELDCFFC